MAVEDDTLISRLYRDGTSIRGTAAASRRAPKTVHRRLQAAGVPLRRPGGSTRRDPPVQLTPGQIAEAAATYTGGTVSLHDLGAAYGVSGDTMARKLRAAGAEIRPRGRTLAAAPAQASADVLRLHHQGLPPRDIAAQLGRGTAGCIARELRRAGLTPHRGRPMPAPVTLAVAYARAGSLRALQPTVRVDEVRLKAALSASGVPVGSLRRVPPPLRAEVARLAASGVSRGQISVRTGLKADLFPQVGRPVGTAGGSPARP
jgi:hypothetical protein